MSEDIESSPAVAVQGLSTQVESTISPAVVLGATSTLPIFVNAPASLFTAEAVLNAVSVVAAFASFASLRTCLVLPRLAHDLDYL